MIVSNYIDKEIGIYHSGESRILLEGMEAEFYKKVCNLFLNEFNVLDDHLGEDWINTEHEWQKEESCHRTIYTGIYGFDFEYPVHLKIAAIKHCCDLLTNPESKLPALGYDTPPLKVTAEGLALAPLSWLRQNLTGRFEYLRDEGVLELLWNISQDYLKDNGDWGDDLTCTFDDWRKDYPESLDDADISKWRKLCLEISERLLSVMDEDWQMFFHKAEIYENYIRGTELLPIENNTEAIEPIAQTTLEQQQTESLDSVFIPSFSIKKLAKILLGDHNNLPDSPGIYFALDAANRIWYVGISTTSLRERHAKHEKLPEFKEHKIQHIAYFVWTDVDDLEEWEIGYIQKFDPPLNMNHVQKELPQIDLGYGEENYINRYREIKEQIALLEQEMEELKPNLVTLLEREGGKIADKMLGFSGYLVSRKSYQYSPKVESLMDLLKQTKKQEEEDGTASVKSITTYPSFRFK